MEDKEKKFFEIEYILKDILTPYVWVIIKELNNYLLTNNYPFILIVVGGDALHNFFPYDDNLRSHDFDIRLAPILNSQWREDLVSFQHGISLRIIKYFEKILNEYKKILIPTIIEKLTSLIGPNGLIGNFEAYNDRDLYTLQYDITFENKTVKRSLIDLFIVKSLLLGYTDKINTYNVEKHINKYNTNNPETYIPYIKMNDINYGSLGFLISDTVNMINLRTYKVERYKMKFDHIIKNLYNPKGHLSCTSMKEFVKDCSKKTTCVINGKNMNKQELLNYAIDRDFIPIKMYNYFSTLSLEYLCYYITKLIDGLSEERKNLYRIGDAEIMDLNEY